MTRSSYEIFFHDHFLFQKFLDGAMKQRVKLYLKIWENVSGANELKSFNIKGCQWAVPFHQWTAG